MGTLSGWSSAGGKLYPPVNAEDAIFLIEKKGYEIIEDPQLSFQLLREGTDSFLPFWVVKTKENQIFYVIFTSGITKVFNANVVHPIK